MCGVLLTCAYKCYIRLDVFHGLSENCIWAGVPRLIAVFCRGKSPCLRKGHLTKLRGFGSKVRRQLVNGKIERCYENCKLLLYFSKRLMSDPQEKGMSTGC